MAIARGLLTHGALLLLSTVLAVRTWTKGEDTGPKHGETDLWPGTVEQVQSVRFESKVGTLLLEPRQDTNGRYFVGTVKKNPNAEPPKKDPHDQSEPKPAEPPSNESKTSRFVTTKDGEELVGTLAPLRALRVLGKTTDAQKTDFGFDQDEGKLYVKIGGTDHALVFGGPTPGGTDRYAKDPANGNAYVVSGSILRDLTNADQRLLEHRLHGWEDSTAKRVKVSLGGVSREFVRSSEKKDSWTKVDAPAGKDETVTNWMGKLERLRVTSYEGEKLDPPVSPTELVVKVEYFDDRKPIGFIEISRRPGTTPDKPEYVARTEHTRWFASVIRSAAEQIDQDVKSVVTP